jgi:hypothetical protein
MKSKHVIGTSIALALVLYFLVIHTDQNSDNGNQHLFVADTTQTKIHPTNDPSGLAERLPEKEIDLDHTASQEIKETHPLVNQDQVFKNLLKQNLLTFSNWKGLAVFDGDIIIGELEQKDLQSGHIEVSTPVKWPSPFIPYTVHKNLPSTQRRELQAAINYLQKRTPLRFIDSIKNETSFLFFVPATDDKCASYLGRQIGGQQVYLGNNCKRDAILHEIMHALGFIHEHSRFDRDQFLKIDWEQIENDKIVQFALVPEYATLREQTDEFDFHSRMIYSQKAFSLNGKDTIIPYEQIKTLGTPFSGLSTSDLQRIKRYFE